MSMATAGTELLKQLVEGEFDHPTPETVSLVRKEVVPALSELIDRGFRARPLQLAGETTGMIRGLHLAERRQLFIWYPKPEDRIYYMISLATTFSKEVIDDLDGYEAQQIIRLIDAMTDADMSLYPYVSAFSSTSASELIWYSRGASVTGWSSRTDQLPDGSKFTLLSPPDHARLWAGVAQLRERSKRRLDDTYNAAMITRALTGKGSDKLYSALKKQQLALQSDSDTPWIKITKADSKAINFKDGWGHSHQDDSVEGIMREIGGVAKMDKHEQFMDEFYKRQMEEARRREEDMDLHFKQAIEGSGLEETVTYLTDAQVAEMDKLSKVSTELMEKLVTDGMLDMQVSEERREHRNNS